MVRVVCLEDMDEGLGDEEAHVEVAEGTHLLGKDSEYSQHKPPESSNIVDSRQRVTPGECDSQENPFRVLLAEILEGKNANGSISPANESLQPFAGPRSMDDAGNMVEELMVRNLDSSNVAIVGMSNNRERMQARLSQWQLLYQLGGGFGSGSSCSNTLYGDNGKALPSAEGGIHHESFAEALVQKSLSDEHNEVMENLAATESKGFTGNVISDGGIRTKILSKSGFSELFIKNTLKGKGILLRGPPRPSPNDGRPEPRNRNHGKVACGSMVASDDASLNLGVRNALPSPLDASVNLGVNTALSSQSDIAGPNSASSVHDGLSLREWLKSGKHKVNKVECLNFFRQIVELVDQSHAQGVALRNLRPSCLKLSQSNRIKYVGSMRDTVEGSVEQDIPYSEIHVNRRRPLEQGMFPPIGIIAKRQKLSDSMNQVRQWPLLSARCGLKLESASDVAMRLAGIRDSLNKLNELNPNAEYGIQGRSSSLHLSSASQQQFPSMSDHLEVKWYTSPQEMTAGFCTISSNIYSLGVLLFELLGHFDNERAHAAAMSDLRHRILPPHFLSENPAEAGFCLWLLHPEPSSRPTTREILQSEVISGVPEVSIQELSSSIDEQYAESESLLHFLILLKDHKQNHASKLVEHIGSLEADIEEVKRRNHFKVSSFSTHLETNSRNAMEHAFHHNDPSSSEALSQLLPSSSTNEKRLIANISQLESAYFSMRSKVQHPDNDGNARQDKDLLQNRGNWCLAQEVQQKESPTDSLGAFFDGLCRYARYSKFEVRGLLRTGDLNSSANVICSLSFDRDLDYLAAAGISKKIKIFEFNSLFNDSVDIQYPVIEMSNKSKLSCVCWNNYIRNYLASTDYDGVVKLWDAGTGQEVHEYNEHERRAWSVDFSPVYPTKLASGSDDCSVKLWNINEKSSLATIRNIANVCCVQFSSHSTHLLAFGSADYKTYCYDLRNVRMPWCVLAGHEKAVSYVKFLDPETLVTASTDNSLKLWDLNKTSSTGLSTTACRLTLGGHTNEKNFVGLSVSDGYIACGSETNEVYAYYRSLPMPITCHKFGSIDPISGRETDDDNGQFVSSVCWRGTSDMIVAANSSGCVKVLQMV